HPVDIDVEQRHALLNQTLGARQTYPALIREQFADRADTTAAQMVDVIEGAFAAAQVDQVLDRGNEILVGQNPLAKIDIDPQFLVDLVAANTSKIVFLRIEKEPFEQRAGVGNRRGIS